MLETVSILVNLLKNQTNNYVFYAGPCKYMGKYCLARKKKIRIYACTYCLAKTSGVYV